MESDGLAGPLCVPPRRQRQPQLLPHSARIIRSLLSATSTIIYKMWMFWLLWLAAAANHAAMAHFAKVHLPRVEPQIGIPEGSAGLGLRARLQVTPVNPPLVAARLGERVELECQAFGSPPPSIQWLRDGQPIQQYQSDSVNNLLTGTNDNVLPLSGLGLPDSLGMLGSSSTMAKMTSRLVLDCALPVHRAKYSCAAVSATDSQESPPSSVYVEAEGVRNLSALLSACHSEDVLGTGTGAPRAPRIVTFASFVMDLLGSDVTLPCIAQGTPSPTVYWKDNSNNLIAPTQRRGRYKVLPNGSLLILKLRWSDMGIFTCVVQNNMGKDNSTTFLYPVSAENCKKKSKATENATTRTK